MALPRVYFDVNADGSGLGRIVVEVCYILIFRLPTHLATPARRRSGRRDLAKTTLQVLVLS